MTLHSEIINQTLCFGSVELFAIVHPTGIFVWWPDTFSLNVTQLTLQFRSVSSSRTSSPPPRFTSEIVGTRSTALSFGKWHDVGAKLVTIPVNGSYDVQNHPPGATTQLILPGSVTGILIPNTNQVTMRVVAPIMDGGQEVVVDNTFLQWTNIPNYVVNYTHVETTNSIRVILHGDSFPTCLKLCYASDDHKVYCFKW